MQPSRLVVGSLAILLGLPVFAAAQSTRFAYECSNPSTGLAAICLVKDDGTNRVVLSSPMAFRPKWSPDGSQIAFDSSTDVFVMNADGSNVIQVTHSATDGTEQEIRPAWSPDGASLIFQRQNLLTPSVNGLYVVAADGAAPPVLLVAANGLPPQAPAWSRDGKKIAFSRGSNLFTVNADGTGQTQIASNAWQPAWSPNSKKIAYQAFTSATLFVANADGSAPSQLTATGFSAAGPATWSSDGSRVAFWSQQGSPATYDLDIINADGTGGTQTIVSQHTGPEVPDWEHPGLPIILVPGFAGSRIVCGAQELWPNIAPTIFPVGISTPDFFDMRLASDGISNLPQGTCNPIAGPGTIVDTVLGSNIYKPAMDFLERIAPGRNYTFPWDWRTTPSVSLTEFDAFIDNVRAAHNGQKVVLMAHSMGGLLSRWYIDDPAHADKVARLLTVGTPYWGSPKALWPLAAGIESPTFSNLDPFIDNAEFQQWAVNAFGLYFLYPSSNYGAWLTVTSRGPSALDSAGVLDFVGNDLGGNAALLSQAFTAHATVLDGFKTNGVDYRAVVGTGLNTLGAITIDPFSVDLTYVSGDETVPATSGVQGIVGLPSLGEAVPIGYACGVSHVDLPGDPQVTDAVQDFLLTGGDLKGLTAPCSTSGFEIVALTVAPSAAPPVSHAASVATTSTTSSSSMTLDDAEIADKIDVLRLPTETVIVTNASNPTDFDLPPGTWRVRVTPIADGVKGAPAFYGPISGTATLSTGVTVAVLDNGTPASSAPPLVMPALLDFGTVNVGASTTLHVIVTNGWNSPVTIDNVALTSPLVGYSLSSTITTPIVIGPNGFFDIPVIFTPVSDGPVTTTLVVNSVGGQSSIALTGLGSGSPRQQLADTLIFFDASMTAGTLVGAGPGRSADGRAGAWRNMLVAAAALLDQGRTAEACSQLSDAAARVDGPLNPPDFVTGSALPLLLSKVRGVQTSLGCR
jgi:Tol biopolymer transport system component